MRIIGFIIGCIVVLFWFWLGGFDFGTRGPDLQLAYLLSILGGVIGMILVFMNEDLYK